MSNGNEEKPAAADAPGGQEIDKFTSISVEVNKIIKEISLITNPIEAVPKLEQVIAILMMRLGEDEVVENKDGKTCERIAKRIGYIDPSNPKKTWDDILDFLFDEFSDIKADRMTVKNRKDQGQLVTRIMVGGAMSTAYDQNIDVLVNFGKEQQAQAYREKLVRFQTKLMMILGDDILPWHHDASNPEETVDDKRDKIARRAEDMPLDDNLCEDCGGLLKIDDDTLKAYCPRCDKEIALIESEAENGEG